MTRPALIKLQNAGWLILERGLGALIAFFVMTLVARHLGPSAFGLYAYLLSLAALFMPVASFGLEPIVMRNVGLQPEARQEILGSAMALQAITAIAAFAMALVSMRLFGGPDGVSLSLMTFAALQLLVAPLDSLNAWFRAQERLAWVVIPRIAVAIAVAVITLAMVSSGAPMSVFMELRGLEFVLLGAGAALSFSIATGSFWKLKMNAARLRVLVREGWPVALAGIAVIVYMRIDQVMLGHLSTKEDLGHYSVAVRVAEVALIVPIAIRTSLFASIVRAHDRGPEEMQQHLQLAYDAMTLATTLAAIVAACVCYVLFIPTFGASYAPALPMVLVLLLGLPWIGMINVRGAGFIVKGWLWAMPATASLGAIANIVLNFWAIPVFGAIGAAWTTVITYCFVAFAVNFLFPFLRPDGVAIAKSLVLLNAARRVKNRLSENEAPL